MVKKIYSQTIINWLTGLGISGGTLIGGIFLYLALSGSITDISYSEDEACFGTIEHPCYAYMNFTAKEDIFVYPAEYDPWGRNKTFEFEPNIKDWKLQRSWGSGWRTIPLDKPCTGTWCGLSDSNDERLFSIAFREGKSYQLRLVAIKNNPAETIKWSAFNDQIDPYWLGANESDVISKDDLFSLALEYTKDKTNKAFLFNHDTEQVCVYKDNSDKKDKIDKCYNAIKYMKKGYQIKDDMLIMERVEK